MTTQEKTLLKRRRCPSCKRYAMKDPTDTIPDGYCSYEWCPQYRKVCWTCDVNKHRNHTNTQEIIANEEAWNK